VRFENKNSFLLIWKNALVYYCSCRFRSCRIVSRNIFLPIWSHWRQPTVLLLMLQLSVFWCRTILNLIWRRPAPGKRDDDISRKRQLENDSSATTACQQQLESGNLKATARKWQLNNDSFKETTQKWQLKSDSWPTTAWKRQLKMTALQWQLESDSFKTTALKRQIKSDS
jgi:hypothetical protein